MGRSIEKKVFPSIDQIYPKSKKNGEKSDTQIFNFPKWIELKMIKPILFPWFFIRVLYSVNRAFTS